MYLLVRASQFQTYPVQLSNKTVDCCKNEYRQFLSSHLLQSCDLKQHNSRVAEYRVVDDQKAVMRERTTD